MAKNKLNKYQGKDFVEVSVSDFILRNSTTGVETFIDTVESETLSKSMSTEKVKAGIWESTIFSVDSDQETTLEITDVLSKEEISSAQWAAVEKEGVIVKAVFPKVYQIEATKKITLPEEPLSPDDVLIYNGDKILAPTTGYTITGKIVTIVDATLKVGDSLYISSYDYTAPTGSYSDIGEGSGALSFEILQRKPIFNRKLEVIKWKFRHYPQAKMSSEVEEKGESKRGKQSKNYKFSIEQNPNYPYLIRTWIEDVVTP